MPPLERRDYMKLAGALSGLSLASTGVSGETSSVQPSQAAVATDLQTEYQSDPENLPPLENDPTESGSGDPFSPRFNWSVAGSGRGTRQSAYRVLVASSPQVLDVGVGDVWDSGKVKSAQSIGVSFGPDELLEPEETYYWKVRL